MSSSSAAVVCVLLDFISVRLSTKPNMMYEKEDEIEDDSDTIELCILNVDDILAAVNS